MSRHWTEAQLTSVQSEVDSLASDKASDLAAFLGSKPKNGGRGDGSGIVALRRIQADLSDPPRNTASAKVFEMHRALQRRVAALMVG